MEREARHLSVHPAFSPSPGTASLLAGGADRSSPAHGCGNQAGYSLSAEAGEVEVDGDGVAFGRNYLHGREIGGEGDGGEFQIDGGANRSASAGTPTAGERAATRMGGRSEERRVGKERRGRGGRGGE